MSAWKTHINHLCYFWTTALLLLFQQYSVQVWVGVDIHWLLNDSVICVVGLSTAEPRKAVVAGNYCGGRLGFMLGWAACCCPLLTHPPLFLILSIPLSLFLSYPFTLSLSLYPLIALFEQGME